jgi:hypothetical protein
MPRPRRSRRSLPGRSADRHGAPRDDIPRGYHAHGGARCERAPQQPGGRRAGSALAPIAARGTPRCAHAGADRRPRRRHRPRARGAAGRLRRPGAARGPGDAEPGRAARVRPARHVPVPFDEIASIVDRSPEAARQLASRARRRVQGENRVPDADLDTQREVIDAFRGRARGRLRGVARGAGPGRGPQGRPRRRFPRRLEGCPRSGQRGPPGARLLAPRLSRCGRRSSTARPARSPSATVGRSRSRASRSETEGSSRWASSPTPSAPPSSTRQSSTDRRHILDRIPKAETAASRGREAPPKTRRPLAHRTKPSSRVQAPPTASRAIAIARDATAMLDLVPDLRRGTSTCLV